MSEFENKIKYYENLASDINAESEYLAVGPLAIFTGIESPRLSSRSFTSPLEHLKFALNQEIREWIILYGQSCNKKYRKEMSNVFVFIDDIEKRLSREIKDLEDIRLIMIAVKDLRENEISIDMAITPIEESYAMLQTHGLNIPREEIEQADSLRYRWERLQAHCVRTSLLIGEISEDLNFSRR